MARSAARRARRARHTVAAAVAVVWLAVAVLAAVVWKFTPLFSTWRAQARTAVVTPPTPTPSPTPAAPTTYRVTFDVTATPGASVTPADLEQPLGQAVTRLPYPEAAGQRFLGWTTAPDDPAAPLVSNWALDGLPADRDTTLYPRFEPAPTAVDYDSAGLPILMYHYFYDPAAGETGQDANWMDIRAFDAQVAWLTGDGWYFPDWDEANLYLRGKIQLPAKSIILTSDDGHPSLYSLAIPVIQRYGAKMTGFVIVKDFDPAHLGEYDPAQVFFQSHSYDFHPGSDPGGRLLTAGHDEIVQDVEKTAAVLGTRTAFCYPYGKTTPEASQALADAGVQLGLLIENQRAYPMMDPLSIPRLRMSDGITLDWFQGVVSP